MLDHFFLRFSLSCWLSGSTLWHWWLIGLIQITLWDSVVLTLNKGGCLLRLSDLEEWVTMRFFSFTFFTEIKIWANTALISDALNRWLRAAVTSNFFMNNWRLVKSFLSQVINHQSLECLSCVGLNLFLNNFNKISVELVLKDAWTVAASARHASLVYLRTITFKANETIFIRDLFLFLFGS